MIGIIYPYTIPTTRHDLKTGMPVLIYKHSFGSLFNHFHLYICLVGMYNTPEEMKEIIFTL